MSLHQEIITEWTQALKDGNQDLKKILAFVRSKLDDKAKTLKIHRVNDDDALVILKKMAKEQRDFVEQYRGTAEDKYELEVIENYLPEMMSAIQIEECLTNILSESSLELTSANMGKIMGTMMKKLKGKADGALVREVVADKMK
jgi:uncharacterized protein YqeY